jgi:2-polyprenyl-3-methyl-5-hydroxy-6-metoxy-1,4-benzoquinol methylase
LSSSTPHPETGPAPAGAVDAAAPSKNTVESFYDWMVEVYDPPMTRRHFLEDDRYHNVIEQVAAGPARQTILDTACGNGWLASLYRAEHEVVAIDIADANLQRLQALGFRAIKHDLEQPLPFGDGVFDTVVCSEILEHLFRPDLLLREVMRVLKPGGRVILTVPNLHGLRNRVDVLVGKRTPFIEFRIYEDRTDQLSHVGVQHIRHYTFTGMRSVLQTVGFEQVQSRGQSFHLNANWPFMLLSLLHGGNRGLRAVLRLLTLGRWVPEYPGLELRLRVIRVLARLMPRLSPGMLFVATRPAGKAGAPQP